jgi:hypothetical protein
MVERSGVDVDLEKRILWIDEVHRLPRENMILNEECKKLIQSGTYDVIARVYENTPGIILGKSQHISDVLVENCKKDGVDIARRDSGGSAVYVDSISGATLTYTIFARSDVFGTQTDRKKVYGAFVTPLVRHLGKDGGDFSIEGNFYVTSTVDGKQLPLIGHGFHESASSIKVVQFDGLVHLNSPDVSLISKYLHLRDLHQFEGNLFVQTKSGVYNVQNGWCEENLILSNDSLVFSESTTLSQMKGLTDYGISRLAFLEKFAATLHDVFGTVSSYNLLDVVKPYDFVTRVADHNAKLFDDGRSKVLNGHCFVYMASVQEKAIHYAKK